MQLSLLEWAGIKPTARIIDAVLHLREARGRYIRRLMREHRVPPLSGGVDPISLEDGRHMVEIARNAAKAKARQAKRAARERAKADAGPDASKPPNSA